jgi:hypothetical protein
VAPFVSVDVNDCRAKSTGQGRPRAGVFGGGGAQGHSQTQIVEAHQTHLLLVPQTLCWALVGDHRGNYTSERAIPRQPPTHTIVTQCDLRQWPAFFIWKKNVEVVLRKLTGNTPEALPSARQKVIPSPNLAAEYPSSPGMCRRYCWKKVQLSRTWTWKTRSRLTPTC